MMAASFLKLGLKPPSSDLFFSSPFDLDGNTRRRRRRRRSSVACMLCFAAAAAAVAADRDVLLLVSRARQQQQQQQALQTITTQSLFKSSLLPDVIENVAQESKSGSSSSYGSSPGSSVVVVGAGEETRETGIGIGGVQGEEGLWSIIIPTYDRRPILTKCLQALETQLGYERSGISRYEVIVVDDGSTDGTLEFLLPVSTFSRSGEEKEAAAIQPFCEGNFREENAHTTTTTTTTTTGLDSQIRVRVCTSQSGERSSSTRRRNSGFAAARGIVCQEPREQIQLSQDLQLCTEAAANDFTTSSSRFTNCEGVEVSDESSDSLQQSQRFPHVKVIRQQHAGATRARNLGVKSSRGAVVVFIDSDLVVTSDFLHAHGAALLEAHKQDGDDRAFTYGRVINTSNFERPEAENFKLTDKSAAFFATGNVAISRRLLLKAGELLGNAAEGPFDADFSEYGWEDLELGVRLKELGARIKHVPSAIGYHWHPAFSVDQIPKLVDQERQRGRNGVRFFHKHPKLGVRLMTQMTPFHEGLWFFLTFGGLLNEKLLEPILDRLVAAGKPGLAAALLSPILNWHTVQAAKEEVKKPKMS
ncbi:unnamed protein product [Sphagnum jensenii]|uniref:Glycosyltransferase 2-like domain-containing protein n=1 Tax=Sphagnum jensenii TaxID=128206 RepID=A0ABP1BUX4_9BRYO